MAERSCSNSSCSKESCEGCPSAAKPQSFQVEPNAYTQVKHVIGVVSGKGGRGKIHGNRFPGKPSGREGIPGGDSGRGYHRSFHSQNVRPYRPGPGF